MINRLESSGFPVHRFHADRAQELKSAGLVAWLRDRGIHHSWTPGDTPPSNKAELAVQQLKGLVRKLLRVGGFPVSFWPLAALHASERNWCCMCEFLGRAPVTLLPFGLRVHARKRFKTGYDSHWRARTESGRYLGLAPETPGGHLVWVCGGDADAEGKVLLTNTVYPLRTETSPPRKPKYKLKGKRSPHFAVRVVAATCLDVSPEVSLSRLSPGGECTSELSEHVFRTSNFYSMPDQAREDDVRDLDCAGAEPEYEDGFGVVSKVVNGFDEQWLQERVCNGDLTPAECEKVLQTCVGLLPPARRIVQNERGHAVLCGLYGRGGFHGISRFTREYPLVVMYLNKFLKAQVPEGFWTTIYLSQNTKMPVHRDLVNAPGFPIIVRAVGTFKGGGLCLEGKDGNGPVCKTLPDGSKRAGEVKDIGSLPVAFLGSWWHASEDWEGDRWVISAFVPRDFREGFEDSRDRLLELGFPVSEVPAGDSEALKLCSVCCEPDGELQVDGLHGEEMWEVEFPCEVLDREGRSFAIQAHFDAACLCKTLSRELSGPESNYDIAELLGELKIAEDRREWYESILWGRYLESPHVIVKALNRDIPVCEEEPMPAAEMFLQTSTVSIAEARKELSLWIPAASEEVASLEKVNEAVERINVSDLEELARGGRRVLQVPGKAVLTRKAGVGKRRFRCVACGNYVPQNAHDPSDLYASGVEGLTVRIVLAFAAYHGWASLSADIRTAFLHAPLSGELETEEVIIVKPPSLLVEMNLLSADHRWLVRKALYGLRQAPLAWARFRDKTLHALTFESGGIIYGLKQGLSDDSLWFIVSPGSNGGDGNCWYGILIIYVDDLLGLAPAYLLQALFGEIQKLWKLSEPQWVNEDGVVTFCGIEIQAIKGGGFRISQRAYLKELFTRYEVQGTASAPISQWVDPDDEQSLNPDIVREAQALTGALLWASTKSRPDISFAVSKLGQFSVKAPSLVVHRGHQVLKYLSGTVDFCIEYVRPVGAQWADAPVPRSHLGVIFRRIACPRGGPIVSSDYHSMAWNDHMLGMWQATFCYIVVGRG